MRRGLFWLVVLFVTAGLLRLAEHTPETPAGSRIAALAPAHVRVHPVESLPRLATEEVLGTVRPKLRAVLTAKLSGTIAIVAAAPGQPVKAGALLVEVDAREIQSRLDQAAAIQEQARKDVQRFKALLPSSAVTRQEFDAAEARLRVAEGAAAEARTMLGYTRLLAPFDGVITAKHADVGDLAGPGRPLLEIEDPSRLRVEADVPEGLLDRIKLGDELAVSIPAVRLELVGRVAELSPAADAASRTSRVTLDLPPAPGVRTGQFARVAVPVAEVRTVRVPASAVDLRGQLEVAFVVEGGRAMLRLVRTGKHLAGETEILAGLSVGETLVVEGLGALVDGQAVEAKP